MKAIRICIVAVMAIIAMAMPNAASAQSDNGTLGVKAGYVSGNEAMEMGLFFQYRITEGLRLSPEMGVVLRNKNLSAFRADLDMHFPLSFSGGNFSLYPIAGLNFTAWKVHAPAHSVNYTRIGLNLGAGFEYYAGSNIKLRLQCKRDFTSDFSTTITDIGIGYMF